MYRTDKNGVPNPANERFTQKTVERISSPGSNRERLEFFAKSVNDNSVQLYLLFKRL